MADLLEFRGGGGGAVATAAVIETETAFENSRLTSPPLKDQATAAVRRVRKKARKTFIVVIKPWQHFASVIMAAFLSSTDKLLRCLHQMSTN